MAWDGTDPGNRLLNLLQAQNAYDKVAIWGYLLVAVFALTLSAAYGIYREKQWGWLLAILTVFALLRCCHLEPTGHLSGAAPR